MDILSFDIGNRPHVDFCHIMESSYERWFCIMTNGEIILRGILGPVRSNIRPLALAVDLTGNLLFEQHFSMDDIKVTKHIYPNVARLLNKKTGAASKSIERLTHLCWDSLVEQGLTVAYFGRPVKQMPTPQNLMTYLAVYSYLSIPFFVVIEQHPHFLFQSDRQTRPAVSDEFILTAIQRNLSAPVTQAMALPFSSGYTTFPVCPCCGITLEREYQNFATDADNV